MTTGGIPTRGLPLGGWPLLSIPLPPLPANVYLDDQALSLWIWDGAGTLIAPVYPIDAALEGARYQSGAGSITVASSDPIVALFQGATVGQEFANCSLRAFFRDPTTPLWNGPMTGARLRSAGDAGLVEIDFTQFFGHFTGRRLISESAMDSIAFSTSAKGADNIARNIMARQIGPTGVVTPATYPGGVSRQDFGPFNPDVAAELVTPLSPSLPATEEQSGTDLRSWVEMWCENEDLAVICTDNLDQTFDLDVDYPFLETDRTDTIIFGQWYGNLVSFEVTNNIEDLGNVWSVEGAAAGVHVYSSDAGSITVWGVFEKRQQKPQDGAGNTPDVTNSAGYLKTRFADGTIGYKAIIAETPGCLFNVDWFHRDAVSFDEAALGYQFEQTCSAWRLKMKDGGPPDLEFVFGIPPQDANRQIAAYVGARGRPGVWRNKRQ